MVKNRLKEILDSRGIKQSWLAEKIGVSKGSVSTLIQNKYTTSIDVAFKVSKALNMDIKDIFYEDDDEQSVQDS